MFFFSQEDNALNTNKALETAGYINAFVKLYLVNIIQLLQSFLNPLIINLDKFICFFFLINIFKYTGFIIDKVQAVVTFFEENSQDTPTLFEFYYKIKEYLFHFLIIKKLYIYQVNYKGVNKKAVIKLFQCLMCQRFFRTEESLATY